MKKEFIPYEQALALKELGFDNETLKSYDTSVVVLDGKYLLDDWYDVKRVNTVKAPLYQQAFRWFREKYNLDSFVKHLYKSTIKVGYYFGIDEYKGVEFQMDFDAWYNTYEEAELACLKKLIEIVESNLNK